jgi:hypothetical protein
VPGNDGKSQTTPPPSNEKKRVDSSLRENPWNEMLIILEKHEGGFRGNLLKRTEKEIASFLAMTAKARPHPIPRMKERESIRHCEKTPGRKVYYLVGT